jgi:Spy/CpxP family protein refolding chaperone
MRSATPKRLYAAVALLTLLAFIAGASAGVVGNRLLAPRIQIRTTIGDMGPVLDRLRLTPEQRRRADSIVSRSEPRAREVLVELGARLQMVADSVDAELRAVLTPEQRLRLDSLRSDSRLLLKRKTMTPKGESVDTLLDTSTGRPPK